MMELDSSMSLSNKSSASHQNVSDPILVNNISEEVFVREEISYDENKDVISESLVIPSSITTTTTTTVVKDETKEETDVIVDDGTKLEEDNESGSLDTEDEGSESSTSVKEPVVITSIVNTSESTKSVKSSELTDEPDVIIEDVIKQEEKKSESENGSLDTEDEGSESSNVEEPEVTVNDDEETENKSESVAVVVPVPTKTGKIYDKIKLYFQIILYKIKMMLFNINSCQKN